MHLAGASEVHADVGSWAGAGSIPNKSACDASSEAVCSARLHAEAGVDAGSCAELCAVNAEITSRRKVGFSRFSSMSFCKLASIARGVKECEKRAGIAAV